MPITTPFGPDQENLFMEHALALARTAYERDEVPVGAVVVTSQGTIIGRGYNVTEQLCSQSGHAEVEAIAQAGKKLGDWRLEGCWIYVTLEPCAMCLNLITLSRMAGVVFGAASPLFGSCLDKDASIRLYKKGILSIVHTEVDASVQLLRQFFQQKRIQSG
jgi:tRNA(adenine34) deaminase